MTDAPTKELLIALSDFQKTTLAAHKDSSTGRFKYATETSINDTIRTAKAQGLAHTFTMTPCGVSDGESIGQTEVRLRVYHAESGGYIQSSMLVADYDPKNTRDIRHQQRGSGISYAKRYLLAAAFGLATEENEGECLSEDIQAEAKAPAKPKANGHAPAKAKPAAKPSKDPLADDREAIAVQLKALCKSDKDVYPLWCNELKAKFHGTEHPITADRPTPDNLICEEHFAFCEDFIARLKSHAPNGKA